MKKTEVCDRIRDIGVIPAIRVSSTEEAHFAAECVASAGIPIVEITMTVPEAVRLISHLVQYHPKMIVGAGTVLNPETANQCVDAGAVFLTGTGLNKAVIEFSVKKGIAILPGALTPTEIIEAWDAGADFIKVFPCAQVGGASYIKAVNSALPHIPLIATGGVTQQTADKFILAGASAIGVGTELIPIDALENRESERIQELAKRFQASVKDARDRLKTIKERPSESDGGFWRHLKRT